MTTNGLSRKNVNKELRKRKKEFAEEKQKLTENRVFKTAEKDQEHKESIAEYYKKLSPQQKALFDRQLEYKKMRDSYAYYVKYVHPTYKLTKFHALLCNLCQWVVEQVEKGKKIRICISCPPQHGKSMSLTETLPSWFIGRNPNMRAIITAYNADIAEKFGDRNRQLVKEFGKDIFNIRISESQDNKTLWNLDKTRGGLYSAGILGGLTSNTSQLTIVDDPYKNGVEAENPEIREKIYQTFADSVVSRSNGIGNAIIVIHTRWHDDDLIGRLVEQGWIYFNIPAVWESGEDKLLGRKPGQTLCPELGFDAEWAEQTHKLLGNRKWSALYQGKPYVDGGNIVKREDIRYYNQNTLPPTFQEYVLSCDLTFGGLAKADDPYCMTLWGRNEGNHYLLKIYNRRASFKDTALMIRTICSEYPQLRKKIIESKANGRATIELLGQEIGGFIPFDPKNLSKEDRLNNVVPYFEGGNVYFPCEEIEPRIEEFVGQLLKFPNTTHDDFVDTISQYLLNYEYRYGGKVNTDNTLSLLSRAIRGH